MCSGPGSESLDATECPSDHDCSRRVIFSYRDEAIYANGHDICMT